MITIRYPEILTSDNLLQTLTELAQLTTTNTEFTNYANRDKFYHSREWRHLRAWVLVRDNEECQVSKSLGKVDTTSRLIVHHIYPLEYYPELKLNPNNLIVVSQYYHNMIHGDVKEPSDEWW